MICNIIVDEKTFLFNNKTEIVQELETFVAL